MELDMTKGNPRKLITKFIIPIIIGNIFQQLYNMADTIIVGRFLGVKALAAVGATGAVNFLILGFTMGLTTGFTVLTAQFYGAGDREAMKRSIGNAAILSIVATAIMTYISIAGMNTLLKWMNTPDDIFDMAREYIVIICAGIACSVLYNLLASILRAIGNSVVPLVLLVISSITNVVLDLVFIINFDMGVGGAAYATIISQGLSGVLCLFYIIYKVPTLHIEKKHWRLDEQCIKNQLSIGVPMALQFSITAIGTILVQAALNLLGSTVVAAYSVATKVEQLVTQPFGAMGSTMATYCAQNRGINDIGRIKKGVKIANIMSAIYAVIIYGVVYLILPFVINLFVKEDVASVYGYARTYIVICGVFFIPLGMIFIYRNAMQGCGFSFIPMLGGVVELVSRCVLAFVAASMLSFVGVCFANASAWFTAGFFLLFGYKFVMSKMLKSMELMNQSNLVEQIQTEDLQQTNMEQSQDV